MQLMSSTGHDYLRTLDDFGDAAPDNSRKSCLVVHAKRAALHVSCVHVAKTTQAVQKLYMFECRYVYVLHWHVF